MTRKHCSSFHSPHLFPLVDVCAYICACHNEKKMPKAMFLSYAFLSNRAFCILSVVILFFLKKIDVPSFRLACYYKEFRLDVLLQHVNNFETQSHCSRPTSSSLLSPKMPIFFQTNKLCPSPLPSKHHSFETKDADTWRQPLNFVIIKLLDVLIYLRIHFAEFSAGILLVMNSKKNLDFLDQWPLWLFCKLDLCKDFAFLWRCSFVLVCCVREKHRRLWLIWWHFKRPRVAWWNWTRKAWLKGEASKWESKRRGVHVN